MIFTPDSSSSAPDCYNFCKTKLPERASAQLATAGVSYLLPDQVAQTFGLLRLFRSRLTDAQVLFHQFSSASLRKAGVGMGNAHHVSVAQKGTSK